MAIIIDKFEWNTNIYDEQKKNDLDILISLDRPDNIGVCKQISLHLTHTHTHFISSSNKYQDINNEKLLIII